jgi:hypothetical protein
VTEDFLSEVERAIYKAGCLKLMAAILECRKSAEHGTVSLTCGLTPARASSSTVLRSAEVVKAVRSQVLVAATEAVRHGARRLDETQART